MEKNKNIQEDIRVDERGFKIGYHDGIGLVIGWERWGSVGGWYEIYASEPTEEY